jgi:ribosomal protein L33
MNKQKKQNGWDPAHGQFKCEVGGKKFYVGTDERVKDARKLAIKKYFENVGSQWTMEHHEVAKRMAKGERILVSPATTTEQQTELAAEPFKNTGADVVMEFSEATVFQVLHRKALHRIEQLENLIREKLGTGAVAGPTVSVWAALDEFIKYIPTTQVDAESARTCMNSAKFAKRHVTDMPLSALDYHAIHAWCKTIERRPNSLKTGEPIKRLTVRNSLRAIRRFVAFASRHYLWTKPEDWKDATFVLNKRTKEERREDMKKISQYYTLQELGTLWKFAIPSERLLMLLALNFGFVHSEIGSLELSDLQTPTLAALRPKSDIMGIWPV